MTETNEISIHEARFYIEATAKTVAGQWLSSKELAERAQIAPRTARAFSRKFVSLGLFDVAEVYPGHRYRFAEKADKRNAAYTNRLQHAAGVFGLHEKVGA